MAGLWGQLEGTRSPDTEQQRQIRRRPLSRRDDPDLCRIINAWPGLPEAIRAGIVAMVNTAIQSR